MADLFHFNKLDQQPNLVHGVATAEFGNMSFNWGDYQTVRDNRKRFFDALQVDEPRVTVASLVHGATVSEVTAAEWGWGIVNPEESLEADILVTAQPDTFLFMVVADCLALFLFEPDKQVCALVHAGWRGVEARAPEVAIRYLIEKHGCRPERILAGMSPAIQAKSFSFPTENVEQNNLPNWAPYLKVVGNETQIDFTGYAYQQLLDSGLNSENIERSTVDTKTDPRFFSHRRSVEQQLPEARFGCLIGFKNSG